MFQGSSFCVQDLIKNFFFNFQNVSGLTRGKTLEWLPSSSLKQKYSRAWNRLSSRVPLAWRHVKNTLTSLIRFAWNILSNNDSSVKLRTKYISQKHNLKLLHLLHIASKTIIIIQNWVYKSIAYHHLCYFYSFSRTCFLSRLPYWIFL